MSQVQRRVYEALIRMHPAEFREEFGRDMMLDFEAALCERGIAPLLGDALASVARQWKARVFVGREAEQAVAGHPFLAGQYCMIRQGSALTAFDLMRASVISILLFLTVGFAANLPNRHAVGESQGVQVTHGGADDRSAKHASYAASDKGGRVRRNELELESATGSGVPLKHGADPIRLRPGALGWNVRRKARGGPPVGTLNEMLWQLTLISVVVWLTAFFLRRVPGMGSKVVLAVLGLLGIAASVAFAATPVPAVHPQILHATGPLPLAFAQASAGTEIGAASKVQNADVAIPAWVVVSVKRNKSGTNFFKSRNSPEGISIENASLLMIIRGAYGSLKSLDDKFIGVPDWAKTDKYDIEAKVDPSDLEALHKLNQNQRNLMLQALLADRFELKVHHETREQPIYVLVIAKNGPNLKPGDVYPNGLKDQTGAGVVVQSKHGLAAQAIPISDLVVVLTQIVGRTIVDKTGLGREYDLTLNWRPEIAATPSSGKDSTALPTDDSSPSIFTALQEQLGLRLEPSKGPVDFLVIEHIEKPSEN